MLSLRTTILCLIATASGLMAQSETGRAALEGTVSDSSGKSIATAGVTVRDTQTGLQRALKTNADGTFRASALAVGLYTLEATAPGFGTSRAENIALTVGETKTVNITLQVAGVHASYRQTTPGGE